MKTLEQLKQEREKIRKTLLDMRGLCETENRDPSIEEARTMADLCDQAEALEPLITAAEKAEAFEQRMQASDAGPDRTPIEPTGIEILPDSRRNQQFDNFGEFLQCVMRASSPGRVVDPRLSTRAATGLNEGVPSAGGFLVDSVMSTNLMKNVWSTGMILPKINKMSLSGNANAMKINGYDETSRVDGSRAGGIRGYWKNEAAAKTASKPTFRQIELNLKKLIGLCYATDEMLEDVSVLASAIETGFKDEFTFKLEDAIINGTGAGEPLGILNAGCVVSVSKETGQTADTIAFENINKMWSRLMASCRPNAVWLINQDCEPQLRQMSLAIGTGGAPVYTPEGGISVSPYAALFGRPVVPVEYCATVGTVGDIILADFSKYVAIDKGGMKSDVSIHVQFLYDESVFRFVYRFDGQPMLRSAVTPFKGTNTLSHYVTLADRG
jgi:HK97 family phage major capsid protein